MLACMFYHVKKKTWLWSSSQASVWRMRTLPVRFFFFPPSTSKASEQTRGSISLPVLVCSQSSPAFHRAVTDRNTYMCCTMCSSFLPPLKMRDTRDVRQDYDRSSELLTAVPVAFFAYFSSLCQVCTCSGKQYI